MRLSRIIPGIILAVILTLVGIRAAVPVSNVIEDEEIVVQQETDVEIPVAQSPDLDLLRINIDHYLDQQAGTYGIYVLDVTSGEGIGINTETVFPAASTIKLPMMLYILDQVASGQASLDDHLIYSDNDWEDGTGYLKTFVQNGDRFPVEELIDYAIRFSDNIATNMLLRRFSIGQVHTYMQSLGGTVTWFDTEINGTTPIEMASYMYAARSDEIANEGLRLLLLDVLAETVFDDRIRAGVPAEVRVEHKIGTLPGVVNDVAFVYGQRPFILAAFSIDVAEDEAVSVITEIAQRTYAFFNGD